ncbi:MULTISPECIES: AbfB domain-containing protein [unclassified Microbacterium]|uniref:AbfB domain-containing protein n=2 Tax=Microbacterium TaxID=33882 RepID=UPI0009DE77AA|nr:MULTISPECIES: AbfB domain-containing protein [unclassified Microbacterium]
MFSLRSPRRGRITAVGVAAALVSALLVSVPVSSAVADDAPGYLVESGAYPDGGSVGSAAGIVLKDGNGGLRVVTCAAGTGQVEVEYQMAGKKAKVCFEAVFRPAVLNLEIAASFGVKAGAQPMDVTYSVAGGPETEIPVPANGRRTVDQNQTGQSTVVVIEVNAVSTDVPATTTTHPRTAITKIRTGLGSCTGTLVDRSWVLTAASCFAADPTTLAAGAPAAPARTLFGPDVANDKTASGTGDLGVKVTHVEPAGNGQDVVLAKLEAPVDDITPMPVATTAPVAGQDIAFTGFGRTASVWVPLTSRTNTYPVTSLNTATVTTAASGASLCLGDGGAPGIRDINGTKTLVAVASQASQAGCHGSGIPAGTASITATRGDVIAPWVTATIENGRKLAGISAGQVLEIESIAQAGACMSTKNAASNSSAGPVVIPSSCTLIGQMRRWELVEVTPTVFALRNYVDRAMCAASSDAAGSALVQAACAPADPKQQWTFREQAAGTVSVVNIASGKVLAAPSTTAITLKTDSGANVDRWKYTNVAKMRYDAATVGSYVSLRTAVGGKSLTATTTAQANVKDVVATSPLALRQESTFRVVKGLIDPQCVSFESIASPGKFLNISTTADGNIVLVAPSPTSTRNATWCAQDAAHGVGFSFPAARDSWRMLRSHKNGLVYGGASFNAGVPNGDDQAGYVPDTAWVIGEPWAAPTFAGGQVFEIESIGQPGTCFSTKSAASSPNAGAVLAPVGCTLNPQMRRWELIEITPTVFGLRNYAHHPMCAASSDAAGSGVVQAACATTDTRQQWTFADQPSGGVSIVNVASGKVLTAPTSTTLTLRAATGASVERWTYKNVTKMRSDVATIGSYVSLRTVVGGKSLTAVPAAAQASVGNVTASSPLAQRQAATFRVVQGLVDPQCYSFESVASPGKYLNISTTTDGYIVLATPSATSSRNATWCAEDAEFGVGLSFPAARDPWRKLRMHQNGLVYGGATFSAGVPNGDDAANYIPDTAWVFGEPWVTAP